MTDTTPDGQTRECTTEPCGGVVTFDYEEVRVPVFTSPLQAATIARKAANYLLTTGVEACQRCASLTVLPWPPESADEFAQHIIALFDMAWTDLTYARAWKVGDAANRFKGALIIPYWTVTSSLPTVAPYAAKAGIELVPTGWVSVLGNEPAETPQGEILAVYSNDTFPPSILEQNYTIHAVYPFTTKTTA